MRSSEGGGGGVELLWLIIPLDKGSDLGWFFCSILTLGFTCSLIVMWDPTLVGKGNKTFFIRVWKPLSSRRVLKPWGWRRYVTGQSGQCLLAVGLDCYKLWDTTSVGERNEIFFIRVWNPFPSICILKPWGWRFGLLHVMTKCKFYFSMVELTLQWASKELVFYSFFLEYVAVHWGTGGSPQYSLKNYHIWSAQFPF